MKLPFLHVVATDDVAASPGFERDAEALLRAGGERLALHLRLRGSTGREFHRLADLLAAAARPAGAWLVVNGRLDIALAAGADAAQLGTGSLPLPAARSVAGRQLALGASVHSEAQARDAARQGADYLVAGSIFETATHPGRPPAGPELVTACARAGVPVIGIGGIDRHNADRVLEAGAAGLAVVRAVWEAPDPAGEALRLIERTQAERVRS
ncbi:MAG: thiamine phosphate synthase [marine benthic group bacterium]|nr:thiamine phosphate synthase [Candidatus Benthicola marisminoris]